MVGQEVWMSWHGDSNEGARLKLWSSADTTNDRDVLNWKALDSSTHIAELCITDNFKGSAFALWKAHFKPQLCQSSPPDYIDEYRRTFLVQGRVQTCTAGNLIFIMTYKGTPLVISPMYPALNQECTNKLCAQLLD